MFLRELYKATVELEKEMKHQEELRRIERETEEILRGNAVLKDYERRLRGEDESHFCRFKKAVDHETWDSNKLEVIIQYPYFLSAREAAEIVGLLCYSSNKKKAVKKLKPLVRDQYALRYELSETAGMYNSDIREALR